MAQLQEVKIVLIEENRIMRERLAGVIRGMRDFQLAAQFGVAEESAEAIAILQPQVILLSIDRMDMRERAAIKELLRQSPQSGIICLSQRWEEKTASAVIEAGAKGYVVKPFTTEELLQAVRAVEHQSLNFRCETMAFFSPKGKSGKTTLIANLAMALARRTGEKIGIIDADVQFGDMAVFFNLEHESTIVEAVRDIKFLSPTTLNAYFTAITPEVRVLCGTKRPELAEYVRPKDLQTLISMARGVFRYLLVDVPHGFEPVSIAAAEAADIVYSVAMISGTYEVEHMRRALDIFSTTDGFEGKIKPVFTRVEPCTETERQTLEKKLGYPVNAILPNAYMLVSTAANNGRMAVDFRPDSQLSRSIDRLVDDICRER